MMSDEEEQGEVYIRHPPSYRSDILSSFIEKLDSRCSKEANSQPRKKRVVGSPIMKAVPINAKKWMLKDEFKCGSKPGDKENDIDATNDIDGILSSMDEPEEV